jgi:type I restriction enzyme R subunit
MTRDKPEARVREWIDKALADAGWNALPHSVTPEETITHGRVIPLGRKATRGEQLRADYVLRYNRDFKLAVVEAKKEELPADSGLQQAQNYAKLLGVKFAYATNGREIVEFDFMTGLERFVDRFPTPDELWQRLNDDLKLSDAAAKTLLHPFEWLADKEPRYYQEIAINRVVQGILQGRKRLLLVMATGTGKTFVAFQVCRKLWQTRWNLDARYRYPKILYLADRNVLVDDPKDKTFAVFDQALHKIVSSDVSKSRDIYFAIYQTMIAVYRHYPPDFFDLVIVDECHRGSARDDSLWREILDYFRPAVQLGLTATPLPEERANDIDADAEARQSVSQTYRYFGNPLYTYSLKQGIEDGFLAPYRVRRVLTSYDAHGWRPEPGQLDRFGREIPDEEYQTRDFHRAVFLRAHTRAVARHITDFLQKTDRMAKTIVFCVDQEHAGEMRRQLRALNGDMVQQNENYIARITSDEGEGGRALLDDFSDPEKDYPVIVTTSRLLTTGVDVPTCANIVLARVVNSMVEFKQIIGRGTRLREAYNKLVFNILDYTNASRLFADPAFDGDPTLITEEEIDDQGNVIEGTVTTLVNDESMPDSDDVPDTIMKEAHGPYQSDTPPRKFYVDEGYTDVVSELEQDLDPQTNRLRAIKLTDYTAEQVRTLYPTAVMLREQWSDPNHRRDLIRTLEQKGIDLDDLRAATHQPEADPFDLLCHLAFNAPVRTRRERAARLRQNKQDFFEQYGPLAREVLNDLLDKYTEHGAAQFKIPDILEVPPISRRGNIVELARAFSGPDKLRDAVQTLQKLLYSS